MSPSSSSLSTSRTSGRIRKRPVSFGNPALGTYHGTVFTWDEGDFRSGSAGTSSLHKKPLVEGAESVERMVAMVDVPPEQVPEGLLNLARSHRPFIDHVRIVIAENNQTIMDEPSSVSPKQPNQQQSSFLSSFSSLTLNTDHNDDIGNNSNNRLSGVLPSPSASAMENAASILAADEELELSQQKKRQSYERQPSQQQLQQPKQSLQSEGDNSRTYLVLFELYSSEAAEMFVNDLHGKPYTSLDETVTCSVHHVVALKGQDGVSLMSPFFAPSTKKSSTLGGLEILASSSVDSNNSHHHNSSGECASLESSNSPTSNVVVAEDHNCPVCLEHMTLDPRNRGLAGDYHGDIRETSILTTVCNHTFHLDCLLQWQDSPCPVCRYDHSGLNEALSQCHVCGTTEHNYVCLICGVVSCVVSGVASSISSTNPAGSSSSHHTRNESNDTCHGEGSSSSMEDAATSRIRFSTSHARQHYDETLHAYALDTETQHVWDFAGQGYVHRLLQNKEDGKLVEVNDPNNTTASLERSLNPGLSEAQEGEVVHRKLEGFASQYYTLLKSQLEQQRIFYEGRLEEIRREYSTKKQSSINKTQDWISALRQERKQLTARMLSLKRRHEKIVEDVAFLKSMNESLEANKVPLQRKIAEAQRQRRDASEMFQTYLPALEAKVTSLMLQLEESSSSSATMVATAYCEMEGSVTGTTPTTATHPPECAPTLDSDCKPAALPRKSNDKS